MEFTFCRGCYIFLQMIKDTNTVKMVSISITLYTQTQISMKFEKICKFLMILFKTTCASVLKLVNRQDLKSCGW